MAITDHLAFRDAQIGTLAYTQALRLSLPTYQTARRPSDFGDWRALRQQHLERFNASERADHDLVLNPRVLLLGIEVTAYLAGGLALLIGFAFANLTGIRSLLSTAGFTTLSVLVVWAVNLFFDRQHRRALERLNLTPLPIGDHASGTSL